MRLFRVPWELLAFVPLTILGQLLVVWASGSPVQPSRGGLLVFGLLLVALACRSSLAWTLLIAWNGLMLIAVLAPLVSGVRFVPVAVAAAFHVSCLTLLLSPAMRRHIDDRSGTPAPIV